VSLGIDATEKVDIGTKMVLRYLPFADHNAILDPSCPDITGRVLEVCGQSQLSVSHPTIRKGVRFLRSKQEKDGSWYGRWGVNYI
jgi:squalene-hopene/tetraprenyl-beta-curcumene cyclase